jgi:hypothetical protein
MQRPFLVFDQIAIQLRIPPLGIDASLSAAK